MRKVARLGPILLLVLLGLVAAGCIDALALRAARAPNYGRSLAELQDLTLGADNANYWRISVGPPSASLSVRVFEPMRALVVRRNEGSLGVRYWVRRWPHLAPSRSAEDGRPPGTILVLHGLHQRKEGLTPLAAYLADQGYRVVVVDLRGHGQSTGNWLTYGSVETVDLVQLVDELQRREIFTERLGVLGLSYGGGLAIQLAGADDRVCAVVAVEPFASVRAAARDVAPLAMGIWRLLYSDQLLDYALRRMAHLTGHAADQPSPVGAIAQTDAPILLVHGQNDRVLSPRHSRLLLRARPLGTNLVMLRGVGHVALYTRAAELVGPRARDWFDIHLAQQPPHRLPLARASAPPGASPVLGHSSAQ